MGLHIYCKWLDSGKYSEVGINKDGNFWIIYKVKVQRGMGHQKANELLIHGVHRKNIERFCERNNCQIVGREDEVPEKDLLVLESEDKANGTR